MEEKELLARGFKAISFPCDCYYIDLKCYGNTITIHGNSIHINDIHDDYILLAEDATIEQLDKLLEVLGK